MKKITLKLISFLLFFLLLQSSFSQDVTTHHFKISGKERVPVNVGPSKERTVEYDPQSPDHLVITDYADNGLLVQKARFLFLGQKFKLSNLDGYIFKAELFKDGMLSKYDKAGIIARGFVYNKDTLLQKIFYYSNGNKQIVVGGDEKQMNGDFKMWYPNGQLSFTGVYKNNKKNGSFESFDEAGTPERQGVYKNGRLISGESVVPDLQYDNPDVSAQYIDGEEAFNNYLRNKTAHLPEFKAMNDSTYRTMDLSFSISKTGRITNLDLSSLKDSLDKEMVHLAFQDFTGFKPALIEGAPVRSLLSLKLAVTNQGLQEAKNVKAYRDSANQAVFFLVEQMPRFPGGEFELRKLIANSIKYPVYAQEHGIEGKVYVNFVIERDGAVDHIHVVNEPDPVLGQEAIRVVKNLPKWIPGYQRGKPVRVSYTIPINFVISTEMKIRNK